MCVGLFIKVHKLTPYRSVGDLSKISDRRSPLQGCLTLKIGNDQQHEHAKENS